MKKCRTCNGTKTIYGMGNMKEKCKPCDGKGFITDEELVKAKTSSSKKPKGKEHDGKEAR